MSAVSPALFFLFPRYVADPEEGDGMASRQRREVGKLFYLWRREE